MDHVSNATCLILGLVCGVCVCALVTGVVMQFEEWFQRKAPGLWRSAREIHRFLMSLAYPNSDSPNGQAVTSTLILMGLFGMFVGVIGLVLAI